MEAGIVNVTGRRFVLLLALFTFVSRPMPARAFDEDGFSTAMTLKAVSEVVSIRGGGELRPRFSTKGRYTNYYTEDPRFPGAASAIYGFCDSLLVSYWAEIPGGFPAFVRLASRYSASMPGAAVQATSDQTNVGTASRLELKWQNMSELVSVQLISVGENGRLSVSKNLSTLPGCNP